MESRQKHPLSVFIVVSSILGASEIDYLPYNLKQEDLLKTITKSKHVMPAGDDIYIVKGVPADLLLDFRWREKNSLWTQKEFESKREEFELKYKFLIYLN